MAQPGSVNEYTRSNCAGGDRAGGEPIW